MSRYDTYGISCGTLDELAPKLQQLLGVDLEERDSSYYAGTYYRYKHSYARQLRLFQNKDPVTGSWVREQYRAFGVILEVSDLDDMDEIRERVIGGLAGAVLLDSREIQSDLDAT
jgi:hypothetical protein